MIRSFDIETIPNSSMVKYLPEPEAPGKIKDPQKIAAAIAEKKKKSIDEMALSPLWGRVCSFVMYNEDGEVSDVLKSESAIAEKDLIEKILFNLVVGGQKVNTFVTWNGVNFDFPFVYKRAAILRAEIPCGCPALAYWIKRYQHTVHIDMMQEFSGWNSYKADSLDNAGIAFYLKGKSERDYSEFAGLIRTGKVNDILEANRNDAILTYNIYNDSKDYLF